MENQFQDLQAIIFKAGNDEFAVNILQVVSIERMQAITPYPNRSPYVLGVTTVRDTVTPVVDMSSALIGEPVQPTEDTRLIIVQAFDSSFGLVVDSATDIINIEGHSIQQPQLLETNQVSYLKGIANIGERLLVLLDIEKLLEDTTNLDELREIIQSMA
ncbi:chemotaxis protein CheW [Pseudoneobacillus sp. C159]